MKIEFRKVPFNKKDFKLVCSSVQFEGTFCRISSHLVQVASTLSGNLEIICDRCLQEDDIGVEEKLDFFLSDGIYENKNDDLVIELEDGLISFDEILQSELASIKSDYHICGKCKQNNKIIEQKF